MSTKFLQATESMAALTPSDTMSLNPAPRALYVGGAGDVSVVALRDSGPVTLAGVPAGSILPIQVRTVRATGTTATDIVALY